MARKDFDGFKNRLTRFNRLRLRIAHFRPLLQATPRSAAAFIIGREGCAEKSLPRTGKTTGRQGC